jgi:hypothetical protein
MQARATARLGQSESLGRVGTACSTRPPTPSTLPMLLQVLLTREAIGRRGGIDEDPDGCKTHAYTAPIPSAVRFAGRNLVNGALVSGRAEQLVQCEVAKPTGGGNVNITR